MGKATDQTHFPPFLDGMMPFSSKEEIEFEGVRTFAAHVQALPSVDGLPLEGAFKPYFLPRLAPHMAFWGVVGDGSDFRARLVGTKIIDLVGSDSTNQLISEMPQDSIAVRNTLALLSAAYNLRRPILYQPRHSRIEGKHHYRAENLVVPFVDTAGAIVKIVSLYLTKLMSESEILSAASTIVRSDRPGI